MLGITRVPAPPFPLLPRPRRALRGRETGRFSLHPRRPSLERDTLGEIPGHLSPAALSADAVTVTR